MAALKTKIRAAVLGASGYTGVRPDQARRPPPKNFNHRADCARRSEVPARHSLAKSSLAFGTLDLPALVTSDEVDWSTIDVASLRPASRCSIARSPSCLSCVKVIDMSADFRLRDPAVYAEWYGSEHGAPHRLKGAVYGLTEHYADEIKTARLVACPGCYPTAVLLALLPPTKGKLIKSDGAHRSIRFGVSRAGRTLKQNILFSEAGEGLSPYGIGQSPGTCQRSSRS